MQVRLALLRLAAAGPGGHGAPAGSGGGGFDRSVQLWYNAPRIPEASIASLDVNR
jgi:hypothetical protein